VEAESVASALYLARSTGCPIVIVHLSSALSLDPIRAAKREGVEAYVETTPLYLETNAYETGAPNGPAWTRVQPSVKFAEDSAALWEAVVDGTVDFIGSDHAATTKDVYSDRSVWDTGASGRSLLGIMLPIMLDAVARGKLTLARLQQVMCEAAARTLNLHARQGRIELGYDANLSLCDLARSEPVTVASLHSRADHSPFEGRTLTGWPMTTVLRGKVIWRDGQLVGEAGGEFQAGRAA
jgi:dihydroorotase-like cyclic amidohydrolase